MCGCAAKVTARLPRLTAVACSLVRVCGQVHFTLPQRLLASLEPACEPHIPRSKRGRVLVGPRPETPPPTEPFAHGDARDATPYERVRAAAARTAATLERRARLLRRDGGEHLDAPARLAPPRGVDRGADRGAYKPVAVLADAGAPPLAPPPQPYTDLAAAFSRGPGLTPSSRVASPHAPPARADVPPLVVSATRPAFAHRRGGTRARALVAADWDGEDAPRAHLGNVHTLTVGALIDANASSPLVAVTRAHANGFAAACAAGGAAFLCAGTSVECMLRSAATPLRHRPAMARIFVEHVCAQRSRATHSMKAHDSHTASRAA